MNRINHILKIYFSSVFWIALMLLGSVLLIYYPLEKQHDQSRQRDFSAQLQTIRSLLAYHWTFEAGRIQELVDAMSLPEHLRVTVVAADGGVLGDNREEPTEMQNFLSQDRQELTLAMKGQTGDAVRWSAAENQRLHYMALPIYHKEQLVGAVRLAQPAEAPGRYDDFIFKTMLWLPVIVLISAGVFTVIINHFWYSPLRRITAVARSIADGDLDARTATIGSTEMARLGRALNDMRDHLARQITRIDTQRNNLMQTVANLREGLLAVDAENHILLMNQAAMEIVHPDDSQVVGKHLQSVVRYADIVDIYYETPPGGSLSGRQVTIDYLGQTQYLEVYAHRFEASGRDGIAGLMVLHDISDLVHAAAMKAEFVANASHELRTPVATLRAAVDSLLEDDGAHPMDRTRLINILHRHVGRLEEMTRDLLDLQTVENDRYRLQHEDVQLNPLIQSLAESYAARAREKNLSFKLEPIEPPVIVYTDRRLFSLIVQNLLDNAVKFTSAGSVVCTVTRDNQLICIRVEDTGCGIRPEDQKRVFERFYQADASRSGDARIRGTGLGLAIVKHAVEQLRANIQLQSTFGKGTVVTLRLPQDP